MKLSWLKGAEAASELEMTARPQGGPESRAGAAGAAPREVPGQASVSAYDHVTSAAASLVVLNPQGPLATSGDICVLVTTRGGRR